MVLGCDVIAFRVEWVGVFWAFSLHSLHSPAYLNSQIWMLFSGTCFRLSDWYLKHARQHVYKTIQLRFRSFRFLPFGRAMIVVALHFRLRLLEADVVEAGKRGSVDVFDGVIGHQKVFLPAHEHVVAALQAIVVKVVRIERFLKVGAERREFALHTFRSNATGSLVSSDLWQTTVNSPSACGRRPRRRPTCASGTDICAR